MQALFDLLSRFSPPLLVIGGYAFAAYGVAQQASEVDCLISANSRIAFASHLGLSGFTCSTETENFARFTDGSNTFPPLEVFFADAVTFAELQASSRTLQIGSARLLVPSLSHLVALKLHAIKSNPEREAKHLGEIARVLHANPMALKPSDLMELCTQFGPPGIIVRLQIAQIRL